MWVYRPGLSLSEENSGHLTSLDGAPSLVDLVSNASGEIQVGCLQLLSVLSQNASGCQGILDRMDVVRYVNPNCSGWICPVSIGFFSF